MKTIGYFTLAITVLASCGQTAPNTKDPLKTDTTGISPASKPALSEAEWRHYSGTTSHFFDSIISGRFNGSVLVAKNGEIIYERYKGFKHPDKRKDRETDSLDSHTSFHLASVSKTFTAMAILKLWQDGKLDIHDEVSKYLAGFPIPGITLQTLLSHRSGLRNYVHFMDRSGWDKRKFLTNGDVLQYIIAHTKEVQGAPPNRHFEYSNTNYALLALIIEKVSGQTYPEFMSKTFFQPLQMQDTYVFSLTDTAKEMASYQQNGRRFRLEFLDEVYGDKNIFSTVRDLLKWDQALGNGQIFRKQILDSAYSGYSFEKPGQRNYGLGWRMLIIPNGKKLIYHNGWWHGNRTVFIRMLDENATIIALCNNDFKRVYAAKKLTDLFGDYRQGHANFDEMENEQNGKGGGEPGGKGGEPGPHK